MGLGKVASELAMRVVEAMQQVFESVNMLPQVPHMLSILLSLRDLSLLDVPLQFSLQTLLSSRVHSTRGFQRCDG